MRKKNGGFVLFLVLFVLPGKHSNSNKPTLSFLGHNVANHTHKKKKKKKKKKANDGKGRDGCCWVVA